MKKKVFRAIVSASVIFYFVFCGVVYFFPQWFFYHPTTEESDIAKAQADSFNAQKVEYQASDGTELMAWYVKPTTKNKIIVFMHGNSYNIEKFYHKMLPLQKAGYGILMPEYRGFGKVKGKITQKGLEQDAQAAVEYLYQQGFKNSQIILYGMSLGSHMATATAYTKGQEQPFAALILEVPFDRLDYVVRKVVPIPLPLPIIMSNSLYDNLALIGEIKSPLLVMGGEKDQVVPHELAENLYQQASQPKKLKIYKNAGHNNLYDFENYKDILSWLKENEKIKR